MSLEASCSIWGRGSSSFPSGTQDDISGSFSLTDLKVVLGPERTGAGGLGRGWTRGGRAQGISTSSLWSQQCLDMTPSPTLRVWGQKHQSILSRPPPVSPPFSPLPARLPVPMPSSLLLPAAAQEEEPVGAEENGSISTPHTFTLPPSHEVLREI